MDALHERHVRKYPFRNFPVRNERLVLREFR